MVAVCVLATTCTLHAQIDFPSLSPEGSVTQIVGHTTIKVKYERPSARGRVIYGELVPWDEVWRTGAGWCTKIYFDKPVKVGGAPVAAGAYALFTIPGKDEWVVILNTDTTLYGSYDYNSKNDVVRFPAIAHKSNRYYEALTIDIDFVPNNARIYISWVDTQIGFEVETTTDAEVMTFINEELLTGKCKDADQYGMGASYYYYQKVNLNDGLKLVDKMIEAGGNEAWAMRLKMNIHEELHQYNKALEAIDRAIELTKESTDYNNVENRQKAIQDWEKEAVRIRRKVEE